MFSTVFLIACLAQSLLCTISYCEVVLDSSYAFIDNTATLAVSFGGNPFVNITLTTAGRRGTGIISYGSYITPGNYTFVSVILGYQDYVVDGHVGKISLLFDTVSVCGTQFDLVSYSNSNPYSSGTLLINT